MNLTPELLGSAVVGLLILLAALGNYIRTKEKPRAADTLLTSIGIGWGDRDQAERLIAQVTRVAVAVEILADKRTARIEEALERLDDQERRDRDRERANERERRQWTEPEEPLTRRR